MKIKTAAGITFDFNDPNCKIEIVESQGELFAFLTCYQFIGGGSERKEYKNYWGSYSHYDKEEKIKSIMETGGKIPDLRRFYE
ncbi:TPA: hypothetical protein SMP77_003644 [Proteus mirabilis]|nr:hypothetical protein [Proteus mirabilis]